MSLDQGNIFLIDIETTGTSIFENDVLHIFIAPLFKKKPALEIFIRYPEQQLKWSSVAKKYFSSYSKEWEQASVSKEDAWNTFCKFINTEVRAEEIVFAGHNVGFDYNFLNKLAYINNDQLPKKISHRVLDAHSLLLYFYLKGRIPKSALTSLGSIKHFNLKYDSEKRHSAKEDVEASRNIFLNLLNFDELVSF